MDTEDVASAMAFHRGSFSRSRIRALARCHVQCLAARRSRGPKAEARLQKNPGPAGAPLRSSGIVRAGQSVRNDFICELRLSGCGHILRQRIQSIEGRSRHQAGADSESVEREARKTDTRCGDVSELRAERLKVIARIATENFGGDLNWALERTMKDEKTPEEKRLKRAKRALKEFPIIGEPGADKIILFAGLAPGAAVPSAQTGVPQRIFFGTEDKNYGKGYRAAQEAMNAELPQDFAARRRAYSLLKKHGQEICKSTNLKCEICPISRMCLYFWENR